jgi:ribosomal protein L11 methyltransferase
MTQAADDADDADNLNPPAVTRYWPALILRAAAVDDSEDMVSAVLSDFSPVAIHDLAERPLPPGGLWDPTYPPIPDPPPSPLHWNVCFNEAGERDRAAGAIREALPHLAIEPVDLPDEDWAARSQKSLTMVHAGRFIIAPPWDMPADDVDATVIVIEPSMGFGTGHHATTRMCLRLLSDLDVSDLMVLDLGTGSGVLTMAAALSGARRVLGVDVDVDAIQSAETSARMNTLPDSLAFEVSDFRSSPPAPADLVLANLTGGMLTSSGAAIGALVRPGGQMILSGFDHTEVDAVLKAFAGFGEATRLTEDNWIALLLKRL